MEHAPGRCELCRCSRAQKLELALSARGRDRVTVFKEAPKQLAFAYRLMPSNLAHVRVA
jgi:hypothetical protein